MLVGLAALMISASDHSRRRSERASAANSNHVSTGCVVAGDSPAFWLAHPGLVSTFLRVLLSCMSIAENVAEVRQRITAAAHRAGRDPAGITFMAVSKTFPAGAFVKPTPQGLDSSAKIGCRSSPASRASCET